MKPDTASQALLDAIDGDTMLREVQDWAAINTGTGNIAGLDRMAGILAENGVSDVIHWGTYNCRVISGTNKLSQHGLANAIDIRGLVTQAGDYYDVLSDWEYADFPTTEAGSFLKWFAEILYIEWVFNIILTPNYNAAHADHFHLDLTPGAHALN